jgi:hypothetical protein
MKADTRARRFLLVCAAAAALMLAAAPAVADPTFPELDIYTYNQTPGNTTNIDLEVVLLPSAPAAESIALTVPTGYRMATEPLGAVAGPAEIDVQPVAGGTKTTLKGTMVATDPASLATNPQVQLCAPGTHGSAWNLALSGSTTVTIPILIDQLSTGGSYRLVACLDALGAASLKPVDVFLETRGVFGNPAAAGLYSWSALVTAFNAAGVPDPTTAFELRGVEPIPETLTLKPSYDKRRKTLTLRGTLLAADHARPNIRVHLFAGAIPNTQKMKEIGVAVTTASGAYVFRQKKARPPVYVWAHVRFYYRLGCDQPSTAPAGCASETTDGTDSPITKVPLPKKR